MSSITHTREKTIEEIVRELGVESGGEETAMDGREPDVDLDSIVKAVREAEHEEKSSEATIQTIEQVDVEELKIKKIGKALRVLSELLNDEEIVTYILSKLSIDDIVNDLKKIDEDVAFLIHQLLKRYYERNRQ